ncbi:MAG: hypothetical protein R3314_07130 [Longimicrobiales bacterium]|nr:hypothetical protein [Longimicrobiales bacterium]
MQTDEGQSAWEPGSPFREKVSRVFSGDWLPRIIVESMLIVVSILLALAVNEYERNREDVELATQALTAFEREIRQNRARLEDVGPYRRGLRDVIVDMGASGALASSDEFQATIGLEALRPAFLTSTVWETALTTGALPHIDFDLVNALSLTYSLQARLEEFSRTGMPELARGGWVPPESMPGAIREVIVYLGELSRSESDLLAAYEEVLRILEEANESDAETGAVAVPRP